MPLDGTTWLDPVAQTLCEAAKIIERRGWVKGSFGTRGGPRCVVGAIQEAAYVVAGGPTWSSEYKYLRCAIGLVPDYAVGHRWKAEDPGFEGYFWAYLSKLRWDSAYLYGTTVGTPSVETWQDQPGRTLEEILSGFARSIDRAIEQHDTKREEQNNEQV